MMTVVGIRLIHPPLTTTDYPIKHTDGILISGSPHISILVRPAWSRPRWCISEKTYRFFSDGARVPIAARRSIHGMPVIAGSLELGQGEGSSYQRPPDSIVMSQEMYPSASILAFGVQAHADRRRDGVTEAFRSST